MSALSSLWNKPWYSGPITYFPVTLYVFPYFSTFSLIVIFRCIFSILRTFFFHHLSEGGCCRRAVSRTRIPKWFFFTIMEKSLQLKIQENIISRPHRFATALRDRQNLLLRYTNFMRNKNLLLLTKIFKSILIPYISIRFIFHLEKVNSQGPPNLPKSQLTEPK